MKSAESCSARALGAIVLFLGMPSLQAQFSGQLAPSYISSESASVQFTSSDRNATASGIPSWFSGVRRTSTLAGSNTYQITVTWTYSSNVLQNGLTTDRSATITAGEYSQVITQPGIDNTFAYSIEPRLIDTDHHGGTMGLVVYANVSSSRIASLSNNPWITLFYNDDRINIPVPPSSTQYGNKAFYRGLEVRIATNRQADAVIEPRTGSFLMGSLGNPSDTFTVTQGGLDNRYLYQPDLSEVQVDHLNQDIDMSVYANYSFSAIASKVSPDSPFLTVSRLDSSIYLPVSPSSSMYQFRSFYEPFRVGVSSNWQRNAVTSSRTGTIDFGGAQTTLNDRLTVVQAGIDNTYKVTLSPATIAATGGTATAAVWGTVGGSPYTYASGTTWITSASGSAQLSFAPSPTNPIRYVGTRSFTVTAQGTDKSKWYEPRTGSILIEGKSHAVNQVGAGFQFESIAPREKSQISIHYKVANQRDPNTVRLFYTKNLINYTEILPADCEGSNGHLGTGVKPGVHSLLWNARGLAATISPDTPIILKVVDTDGWFAQSEPFTLEPICEGCSTCPPGTVEAKTDRSIAVDISLGVDSLGRSLGRFWIHEDTATSSLRTPAALWREALNGSQTFPDNATAFSQVLTPATLAVISDPDANDNTWSVSLFDRATQLGSFDSVTGLYNQQTATPFQTITFTVADNGRGFIETFTVAESGTYGQRTHLFTWSPDASASPGWILEQSGPVFGGVRREQVTETTSADGLTVTTDRRILDPLGILAERTVTTERKLPFGDRITKEERFVVQPDGSTTGSRSTFSLYGETAGSPAYGYLTETYTDYDASWAAYTYGPDGIAEIRRPYLTSGRGSAPAELDLTTISWERGQFGMGPAEDRAKVTSRSLAGQLVSRTVEIFYEDELTSTLSDGTSPFTYKEQWTIGLNDPTVETIAGALSSGDAMVTKTRSYASGDYEDQTRSLLRPDGTITIFEYGANEAIQWSGTASADGHSISKGIRQTIASNEYGQLLTSQSVALPEDLIVGEQIAEQHDSLGRPTRIRHIDGTLSNREYTCCGLASETGRDGITTQYVRDMFGQVRSASRLGITTIFDLSPTGRVRSVAESAEGLSIVRGTTIIDSLGIAVESRDARNRSTLSVESHDTAGFRTRLTTRPDGGTITEIYFPDGQLQSVSGTAIAPRRYEYGVENNQRFTKEIRLGDNGAESEWTQTFTDMAGRIAKVVRSHESGTPAVSTNESNNKGQLIRSVDPDGVSLLFDYNDLGEPVTSAIDANHNGIIDRNGTDRITETESSWSTRAGQTVRKTVERIYEADGSPTATELQVTEAAVSGLESWVTTAGLTTHTKTGLSGNGNSTTTATFPDGTKTVTETIAGRIASVTRLNRDGGQVNRTEFTYDALGRVQTSIDARTGVTTFAWYDDDQLSSSTAPGPQVTAFTYDSAGRPDTTTLPDGGIIDQDWFPTGLIQRQSGARTYPVESTYDPQGRLRSLTTAAGFTHWSYYPASGRLSQKLHGDGRGPTYAYTAAGRLASRISGRGITTAYGYDNAGSLTGIDYSDTTPDIGYTRDRRGRIATASSGGSVTTYGYNVVGQPESEAISGGVLDGVLIDPGYDELLRRGSLEASGPGWNQHQSYGYDPSGRLGTTGSGSQTFGYGYLANSNLLETITSTSGLTSTRIWDELDRLESIATAGASFAQSYTYRHNTANQRDRITREDGSRWDFSYDDLAQVKGATHRLPDGEALAGHGFGYTYDAIGNRTSATFGLDGNRTMSYSAATGDGTQYGTIEHPGVALITGEADPAATVTIDAAPPSSRQSNRFSHEIPLDNLAGPAAQPVVIAATLGGTTETETRQAFVPAAVVNPDYDFDGNLIFDGFLEYTWDAENRLTTVKTRNGRAPPGSRLLDFREALTYDHASRLIRRQTWQTLAGQEFPASEDLYVYDGWNQIAVLDADTKLPRQTYTWGLDLSGTLQGAGGVGGLLQITDAATGTSHFPAYDGNGNVTALVDGTTGATTARYEYDPFGNVLAATGSFAQQNPWRFSTKQQDRWTGQYYYGYRHYDAAAGRWLSRDPLGEAGGANLYGFVGNQPIGLFDLLGLILPGTVSTTTGGSILPEQSPIPMHLPFDELRRIPSPPIKRKPCDTKGPKSCGDVALMTPRDFAPYSPRLVAGKVVERQSAIVPFFLGHGNWVGDTRVNGTFEQIREADWSWPLEGQPGFAAPVDQLDRCGYVHDSQLRECARICDPAERQECRLHADKRFHLCATLHGTRKPWIAIPFRPGHEPNNNPGYYHPSP